MGHYNHSLSLDATIMVPNKCLVIGEHVVVIFNTNVLRMQKEVKERKNDDFGASGSIGCKQKAVDRSLGDPHVTLLSVRPCGLLRPMTDHCTLGADAFVLMGL